MTNLTIGVDGDHQTGIAFSLLCSQKKGMKILFFLIGVSLVVALGFLVAFIWAVRHGQYDDDYTPSVRILFDQEFSGGGSEGPENDS